MFTLPQNDFSASHRKHPQMFLFYIVPALNRLGLCGDLTGLPFPCPPPTASTDVTLVAAVAAAAVEVDPAAEVFSRIIMRGGTGRHVSCVIECLLVASWVCLQACLLDRHVSMPFVLSTSFPTTSWLLHSNLDPSTRWSSAPFCSCSNALIASCKLVHSKSNWVFMLSWSGAAAPSGKPCAVSSISLCA